MKFRKQKSSFFLQLFRKSKKNCWSGVSDWVVKWSGPIFIYTLSCIQIFSVLMKIVCENESTGKRQWWYHTVLNKVNSDIIITETSWSMESLELFSQKKFYNRTWESSTQLTSSSRRSPVSTPAIDIYFLNTRRHSEGRAIESEERALRKRNTSMVNS